MICSCGRSLDKATYLGAMAGEREGEIILLVNCTCRSTRARGTNGSVLGFIRLQALAARAGVPLAELLTMQAIDVQTRLDARLLGAT
jgi:hypothetical protein